MRIRIRAEGWSSTATLVESDTTKDFVSLLPLVLTLTDYASTEKIADLPRKLSTKNAPRGVDPSVGDIAYYAPWGNLAVFYGDSGYANGLVRLGRLDAVVDALSKRGPVKVTIERIDR